MKDVYLLISINSQIRSRIDVDPDLLKEAIDLLDYIKDVPFESSRRQMEGLKQLEDLAKSILREVEGY